MAINVNDVYQTVLFILNKEQRGYITPAEFNKIASQVQLEIFEKYFEDLNQQMRLAQGIQDEYADRVESIESRIAIFKTTSPLTYIDEEFDNIGNPISLAEPYFYMQNVIHRLGTVIYKNEQEIQMTNRGEFLNLNMSKLTRPSVKYPLYIQEEYANPVDATGTVICADCLKFLIYPSSITKDVSVSYIRKPRDVVWAYVEGNLGQYIYDAAPGASGVSIPVSGSVDFELDSVEQTEVVLRILMYSGVVIRDPQIIQAAAQQVQATEVNQKT